VDALSGNASFSGVEVEVEAADALQPGAVDAVRSIALV
jgi:hypothetical protein